jgi:carbonic anhydrase
MNALQKLIEGNKRFVANIPLTNNLVPRQETAQGQKPFAVVVTCSDSRLCPEYIFDQEIGKLLVIRNCGNIVDEMALGSIEYAVEYLGVKLVVIMGHEDCGVVTACVCNAKGNDYLDGLMDVIYPVIEDANNISGNVINNAAELHAINMSSLVKKFVENKAEVATAMYSVSTGEVEFLELVDV